LVPKHAEEFKALIPIGSKTAKADMQGSEAVFRLYSRGIATCRDGIVYGFQNDTLTLRVNQYIEDYNSEVDRYKRLGAKQSPDDFVDYKKIKWSRDLPDPLIRGGLSRVAWGAVLLSAVDMGGGSWGGSPGMF
jgi:predicted helicase